MSHCSGCGAATVDQDTGEHLEGVVAFDYGNQHYVYCPACIAGGCMRTDYLGTMVPADLSDMFTYFDGDSSRHCDNPRSYQYPARPTAASTFDCAHCDTTFYGTGAFMEDTERVYCIHCAENNCRWEDPEDGVDEDSESGWFEHPRGWSPPLAPRRSPSRDGSQWETFPGSETSRFLSAPLVGIEFEHAPVRPHPPATEESLFKHIISRPGNVDRMTNHGDGSIAQMSGYSATEIVTFPASGDQLDHVINEFYRPFSEGAFSPGPEHSSCGFHVHVGSRFLFKIKSGIMTRHLTHDCRIGAKELLFAINKICREYISSTRRANGFCSTAPGVRDKDCHLSGTETMVEIYGRGGYPSVAVRTLGTMEFRLWPSSNSIRNTKARVELSQKLINYYDYCFVDDENNICFDKTRANELAELQKLCRGGERKKLARALGDLLILSPEAVASLEAMSDRFSPFTSKKTFFKFSELQIASMSEEDSLASIENPAPSGVDITDVGDTTISGGSRNSGYVYISLGEAIKVYPSSNEGAHAEATKSYAKGER